VSPAKIGFPLVLMGGTEYIAPRNQPVMYNLNKRNGKNFKLDLFQMMRCQVSCEKENPKCTDSCIRSFMQCKSRETTFK
jgi:hypothetical protein